MALRLGVNIRELEGGVRVHRELNGRRVTLLKHGDSVHCFDSLCHHQGGDLGGLGDIEDFKGTCVIRCPVHRRRVSLATGDVVDTDLFGNVCAAPGGPKQRIHACYVDVDGAVRVVLNSTDLPRESDKYNLVSPGPGGVAGALTSAAAAAAAPGASLAAAAAAAAALPSAAASPAFVTGGGLGGSGRGLGGFGVVPASRGGRGVAPTPSSLTAAAAARPLASPVAVAVAGGPSLAGGNNGLTPYAGSDAATKYEAQRLEEAARVASAAAVAVAGPSAAAAAAPSAPSRLRPPLSSSSSSSLSGDSSSSDASPSTSPPIPGYYNPNRHNANQNRSRGGGSGAGVRGGSAGAANNFDGSGGSNSNSFAPQQPQQLPSSVMEAFRARKGGSNWSGANQQQKAPAAVTATKPHNPLLASPSRSAFASRGAAARAAVARAASAVAAAAAAASPAPTLQQATLNAYFSPAAAGAHRATRMMMVAAQEAEAEAQAAAAAVAARNDRGAVSPPLTQPDNDLVLSMEF